MKTLTQLVEIIPDGMAKEKNKYEKPSEPLNVHNVERYYLWQLEQYNRRVFKIVDCQFICEDELIVCHKKGCKAIGSTHTAECNLENMTCIIK